MTIIITGTSSGIGFALAEYFGKTKPFDPEEIRRKTLPEQGAEVIYSNPKGRGPFNDHGHH